MCQVCREEKYQTSTVLLYIFINGTMLFHLSCHHTCGEAGEVQLAPTYRHVLFHTMLQFY